MIDIEALIYVTGVTAIMAVLLVIICQCIYLLAFHIVKKMCNKLYRVYNHTQLHYFMKMILEKGYAQARDDQKAIMRKHGDKTEEHF